MPPPPFFLRFAASASSPSVRFRLPPPPDGPGEAFRLPGALFDRPEVDPVGLVARLATRAEPEGEPEREPGRELEVEWWREWEDDEGR